MSVIKISELEEASTLQNTDELPIVNENETRKVSLQKLFDGYATTKDVEQMIATSITDALEGEY